MDHVTKQALLQVEEVWRYFDLNGDRRSGHLLIIDVKGMTEHFNLDVGSCSEEEKQKHSRLSREASQWLINSPSTSFINHNLDNPSVAIKGYKLIFAFAGMTPHAAEVFCALLGLRLGLISEDHVCRTFISSRNNTGLGFLPDPVVKAVRDKPRLLDIADILLHDGPP